MKTYNLNTAVTCRFQFCVSLTLSLWVMTQKWIISLSCIFWSLALENCPVIARKIKALFGKGAWPHHQFAILPTFYFVNFPFCHSASVPIYHLVISSTCHFINLPFCQIAIMPTCHFANLQFHLLVISSVIWLFPEWPFPRMGVSPNAL